MTCCTLNGILHLSDIWEYLRRLISHHIKGRKKITFWSNLPFDTKTPEANHILGIFPSIQTFKGWPLLICRVPFSHHSIVVGGTGLSTCHSHVCYDISVITPPPPPIAPPPPPPLGCLSPPLVFTWTLVSKTTAAVRQMAEMWNVPSIEYAHNNGPNKRLCGTTQE